MDKERAMEFKKIIDVKIDGKDIPKRDSIILLLEKIEEHIGNLERYVDVLSLRVRKIENKLEGEGNG